MFESLDFPPVVSLTDGKVHLFQDSGQYLVSKLSSDIEFATYSQIKSLLSGNSKLCLPEEEYTVCVPEIVKWDPEKKELITEFIDGYNLEMILRSEDTQQRKRGIDLLNALYSFFISNEIYWIDFAPRNIIIKDHLLYVYDFDRGIPEGIAKQDFVAYTYKDYAAFLLPEERDISEKEAFDVSLSHHDKPFYDIKSGRISLTLRHCFGHVASTQDKRYEYYYALRRIAQATEPFLDSNGAIVFPIIELEKIRDSQGNEAYIMEIMRRQPLCKGVFVSYESMVP